MPTTDTPTTNTPNTDTSDTDQVLTPAAETPTAPLPNPTQYFPELSLRISALEDPVLAQLGFDPRSDYVERYWLSILGPSAVLFLRRVATRFDTEPNGFDLDLVEWAQELGLGGKGGKHSPMWRTLDRICRFGLASRNGPNVAFRQFLPPLTSRQIERLPAHLQRAHQDSGNQAA